jgi:protein-S-isoprenylcysteine O-methyltransferase Ste14
MPAAPNTIPWPPILYTAAAAAAWAVNLVVPLPLPDAKLVGGLVIILALMIDVWAAVTFRRHRTTILPNRAASRLITSGPFRLSRNPIYVANTLLVVGLGIYLHNGWMVLLAFAATYAVQKLAIEREERHLAQMFGTAWEAYVKVTPRWVGI